MEVRSITGSDKTRQNLTPKQRRAIELCLAGRRDEEIARTVGVSRQTVNAWRNHSQPFADELQCRQNALTRVMHDQQRALAWKAVEVVTRALEEGDAKVALEIGKALGLFVPIALPEGPETIEELEEHRAWLQRFEEGLAKEREKHRAKRARDQARADAQQAYAEKMIEEALPVDEEVYRQRLAELLPEQSKAPERR